MTCMTCILFAINVGINLVGIFILYVGIGLYEEAFFRGVLLNRLLAPLGRSSAAVILCMIISSLIFGWIHLWLDSPEDTTGKILAVLKTLQRGMFGFVLAVALLKVRELGSVIIVHSVNDFLMMASSVLEEDLSLSGDYTAVEDTQAAFITYGLLLAGEILPLILAILALRKQKGPDRGAFIKAKAATKAAETAESSADNPSA